MADTVVRKHIIFYGRVQDEVFVISQFIRQGFLALPAG